MNDACMTESRREERILQLLRLINLYLEKRKVVFWDGYGFRGFLEGKG